MNIILTYLRLSNKLKQKQKTIFKYYFSSNQYIKFNIDSKKSGSSKENLSKNEKKSKNTL